MHNRTTDSPWLLGNDPEALYNRGGEKLTRHNLEQLLCDLPGIRTCALRSNATKHSGAQGITLRMSRSDDGLTTEIDDDGIGVAADTNPWGWVWRP